MEAVTDVAKLKTKIWIIVSCPSTASFGAVHNYLSDISDVCGLSRTSTGLVGVMKKRKNVLVPELPGTDLSFFLPVLGTGTASKCALLDMLRAWQ
eukprot:14858342-Heterocapsa_arctica.AAC.1